MAILTNCSRGELLKDRGDAAEKLKDLLRPDIAVG